jgi:hypothetical protein
VQLPITTSNSRSHKAFGCGTDGRHTGSQIKFNLSLYVCRVPHDFCQAQNGRGARRLEVRGGCDTRLRQSQGTSDPSSHLPQHCHKSRPLKCCCARSQPPQQQSYPTSMHKNNNPPTKTTVSPQNHYTPVHDPSQQQSGGKQKFIDANNNHIAPLPIMSS